ncbi:MAG: hypothetical protein ACHQ3O_09925 [Candidatus Limnocylindria bacterium]|jgi:hypothetical protein
MEPSRPGSAAPRLLSTAYLLSVLGFAAAVSALALRQHLRVPYNDDWRLLDDMYRAPLGEWIFSVQNGHRIPATLLLLHLDQTLAGGRMHLLVAASLACAWITAGALWLMPRGPDASEPELRRVLLGFGIFALFWSGAAYNFQWGVNHGSVWTPMWLLLALIALARARDRIGKPGAARPLLLSAGASVLATFGHGMGFLAWGALLAMAVAGRMPWRWGVGLAAGAIASIALYSVDLFGSKSVPIGADLLLDYGVAHPDELIRFVCAFVGAPVGWALYGFDLVGVQGMLGLSTAVGAPAAILACVYGALVWRRRASLPALGFAGFGLMVFVLGGGLIVGLTRLAIFGASQAVERRFLSWSTLFWIGGAWALGSLAAGRRARVALAVSLAALPLALLPALFEAREYGVWRDEPVYDVALVLLLGAPPDALLLGVTRQSPEIVERVAEQLRRDGRSPFDDERAGLAGARFAERFRPLPTQGCGGGSELAWRVRGAGLATLRGRIDREGDAPAYFVLVDSGGSVRGLGEERPAPAKAPPGRHWAGVIAGFSPHERYQAWAVLRDGRSACRLGEIGGPPA